jgi:hypothetical protein
VGTLDNVVSVMVMVKQAGQREGKPEVSLKNFRYGSCPVCGEDLKSAKAAFCRSACKQAAYRSRNSEKVKSKDRIRKKVTVHSFLRVRPVARFMREWSEREIVNHLGGPSLPETVTSAERAGQPGPGVASDFASIVKKQQRAELRINVSSRPQVANALKPWKDGFLPETECELLSKKRTQIIPAYENGVPVDMAQESTEVTKWRDEKAKRLSAVLGELARAEARKREKRKQDAPRTE